MTINVRKCTSVTVLANRKLTFVALAANMYSVHGGSLMSLQVGDQFRYLGAFFSWKGVSPTRRLDSLRKGLDEITGAPLKPWQRLVVLITYLLPKYLHELVLGNTQLGHLAKLDRVVRQRVREWLRLPSDTPLGYFHAHRQDGGLGINSLRHTVPLLIVERLSRMRESPFPVVQYAAEQPLVERRLALMQKGTRLAGHPYSNKTELRDVWRIVLTESVDGAGLRSANQCTESNS